MHATCTRLLIILSLAFVFCSNGFAAAKPSLLADPRAAANVKLPSHARPDAAVVGRLNAKVLDAPSMQITLPGGRVVSAVQRHVARSGRLGSITWTGSIDGEPGSLVVLTRRKGVLAGFVNYRGRTYELQPTSPGQYLLFEVQEQAPRRDDIVRVPSLRAGARAKTGGAVVGRLAADASPVVQDVLLLYTYAAAYDSGWDILESRILSALEAANASYRASGINLTLAAVGLQLTRIGEGADSDATLDALIASEAVSAERDRLGADIVLLISNDADTCGLAYLMDSDSPSFAPYAYGLVRSACLGNQTLTHELGHIQGLAHDRETDADPGAYPYARGFRRCTTDASAFHDIMAYPCTYAPQQVRINTFSSPDIFHMGNATGIAYEADPVNASDGVRALNLTAATVAAFRGEVALPPPAPSSLNGVALGATSVALQWRDESVTETGFKVYRSTGSSTSFGEIASVSPGTEAYTDNTVAPGMTYSYQVAAYNSAGQSDSNVTVVRTPPLPPAAPDGLAASVVAYDHVSLSWQSGAPDVDRFVVERAINGLHYLPLPDGDTRNASFDDHTTEPGRTYWYQIRAVGSGGLSEPSAPVSVSTPAIVPLVPTQVMAQNNRRKTASVSWTDSALGPASRYEVRRETYKKKQWRYPTAVASVPAGGSNVIVDASGKGTFRYSVRACNLVGCSEFSAPTGQVVVTK